MSCWGSIGLSADRRRNPWCSPDNAACRRKGYPLRRWGEFTAKAVGSGLARTGVKTLYIEPGSLWENGYNESFNGKLRSELPNIEVIYALKEAEVLIESWRNHDDTVRPHSSPGYRPLPPEIVLPNFDDPAYARQWLRSDHQLKPRQSLT